MQRIDAHLHLWRFDAEEYDWLQGDLDPLRRDFLPQDCLRELHDAQVAGAVLVQARQSLAETDWLLDLAEAAEAFVGVVGWLPLRSPDLEAQLSVYTRRRALKGLRHVVQAEPPGFMDDPGFNQGIATLKHHGLVYDILILEHQLEEATRLVDRHPEQSFVLDHLAKPRIRHRELAPWADRIRELARRPNVVCKLSGMITEADPHSWSPEQMQPYFETVVEAFTPGRLMVGTDWPVLTAGCSYGRWWQLVDAWSSGMTVPERAALFAQTAERVYGLQAPQNIEAKHPLHETRLG